MPTLSSGIGSVDATPVEPALYGLLSPAAVVRTNDDPHFANGFDYETIECGASVRLESICAGITSVSAVNKSGGSLWRNYFPFTVETDFQCSTMGMSPEEVEAIADGYLDAAVQKAAEFELWTGALSKAAEATTSYDEVARGPYPNRYLASSTAIDITPTPGTGVKIKYAQALLEDALGDNGLGIRGTIHASRLSAGLLGLTPTGSTEDDYIVTKLGNYVIAGSGYSDTGPNGAPAGPGKAWMYATGRVTVTRGEKIITPDGARSQAVDISNNTTKYFASQVIAVTWNSCAHYAVLVDLALDYS